MGDNTFLVTTQEELDAGLAQLTQEEYEYLMQGFHNMPDALFDTFAYISFYVSVQKFVCDWALHHEDANQRKCGFALMQILDKLKWILWGQKNGIDNTK